MVNNIEIATLSVKPDIDDQLEPIAQRIELLAAAAILQIACEAAKIHENFRYRRDQGGFAGYMKRRLGYSSSSAHRLLNVHTRFGRNVSQIWERLPVSAIYLLAAPSTPEEALNEVAERVKAGEKPSCAMVTKLIAKAKGIDTESNRPADPEAPAIESAPEPAAEDGAAAEREQNSAAPAATESQEPAGDADDVAASTEARKEFYASAYRRDGDGDADHDGDHDGDAHHDDGDVGDHHVGDHHVGGDDHSEEPNVGGDHAEEPKPAPPEPKAELETLAVIWEMSTSEEQQGIRDRVLADFFEQAPGAGITALIPTTKHADVVRLLLDQLGVDATLQAMSFEFGCQLRAKLPRKAKPFKAASARKAKPFKTANGVKTGKETYAFQQGRGGRSRAH